MTMSEKMEFKQENEVNTDLYIYGEIRKKDFWDSYFGDNEGAVGALDFKETLNNVTTPNLTVRINSMGGSVSEALAIYNQLLDFDGEVTTMIDGFACSAASIIFMAGSKRIAPESSLLMIHNAWSNVSGDSRAMLKAAEDLEKITQPSVNIYVSKTSLNEEQIKEKMNNETWITSQEAYDWGFATAIEKNEAKQSISDSYLRKLILENKNLREINTKVKETDQTETTNWSGFFK